MLTPLNMFYIATIVLIVSAISFYFLIKNRI